MVSSRFVWRGHASDVTAWSWACLHCQEAKIHRQMCLLPQPVPIPQRRFSHLHIDLVGLLQYSGSFNFIFNIIDRTSKWMEAVPLSDMSTAVCAKALLFSWISCFGIPEMITSDRGRMQVTSNIWSQLCEMLQISHRQTTAIILSRTVQSKDSIAISRMRFAHAPPRRLGPRSYLLYSSASMHSRGKILVFPWLRHFLALQLSCPMKFYKEINFLLIHLLKN
jgi:hypothetical protein